MAVCIGEVTIANPFIGVFVPHNSPTILNAALLETQFWDGRVQSETMGETGGESPTGSSSPTFRDSLSQLGQRHDRLGDAERVDVEIWVNGRLLEMEGVEVNQVVEVD